MSSAQPCPADLLLQVSATAGRNLPQAVEEIGGLLADYPGDARLHFLRGSFLAGLQLYEEARQAMHTALALAPEARLIRFQTGFLEFTSGLVAEAATTWTPLLTAGARDCLALFADGLMALGQDQFAMALDLLRGGIAINVENAPLSGDMQRVIGAIVALPGQSEPADQAISSAHLLLRQFGRTGELN